MTAIRIPFEGAIVSKDSFQVPEKRSTEIEGSLQCLVHVRISEITGNMDNSLILDPTNSRGHVRQCDAGNCMADMDR